MIMAYILSPSKSSGTTFTKTALLAFSPSRANLLMPFVTMVPASLEEEAFRLGGENYFAPVQRVEDFFKNRKTEKFGSVIPSYMPGVTFANLNEILPAFVSDTLKEGIRYFDRRISGFANNDAIMTGVETRSSSPVRITRDERLMSCSVKGLYPCGEGPGYAGGIMSAAVDGIKCAVAVLESI